MDIWQSVSGMTDVLLTSASPAQSVSELNRAGITVYECVAGDDELTLHLKIARKDYKKALKIVLARGGELKLRTRKGVYWQLKGLKKRPVLLFGLAFLLLAVFLLPNRIYFVRVEGNERIPTKQILERAELCGITFGASRRLVRSEKVKNALLEQIPQLQWAGVNTSGCVATISVRERSEQEEITNESGVGSIIATRDGVVTEITVMKGSPACKNGQAVRAGQVLISGYTDCGIHIQAQMAHGEIYAITDREVEAILPEVFVQRQENPVVTKKYSLIIGKKRINLCKDSGISDTTCVKIYEENYITLPGGFILPVALITETVYSQPVTESKLSQDEAKQILSQFGRGYLTDQMIAGRILDCYEVLETTSGSYALKGRYACNEMIGAIRNEEIITPYVKHS